MIATNKKMIDKPLTSVMEDYLETIYELNKNKKTVRVKDIAKNLSVKMPTVTSMLRTLKDRGLVDYEKYEYVELTKDGADIGKEISNRHKMLLKFLTEVLKIDFETADQDACKMEHALGSETLDSLTDFMEFIQTCPRAGETWLNHFEDFRKHGHRPEKCQALSDKFSRKFQDRIDSLEDSQLTKEK